MSKSESSIWDWVEGHARKLATVNEIGSLLGWDRETMMPPGGAHMRAEQMAYIEGHFHALATQPEYLEKLQQLSKSAALSEAQHSSVRWQQRDCLRLARIPAALVEELARATVHSNAAWIEARKTNNFDLFAPELEKIVQLKKEIADHVKEGTQTPYETLLAEYEPHFSLSEIESLFGELKLSLVPLAAQIVESHKSLHSPFSGRMPIETQKAFNLRVLQMVGFDLKHGRLDTAVHPFCSGSGQDVRLTTRYREEDWSDSLFSVLHECGHGLYELGMGRSQLECVLQRAPSFGMHESQSRFLENCIGRSRGFLQILLSRMKDEFGLGAYADTTVEAIYQHVNRPQFSYIRVDADEVTYNLHILMRFELEKAVFAGDLAVRDLPAAWNEKVKQYLHLPPPNFANGVLQDSHWSWGAFGYFPSYTIGNLIAAELHTSIRKDLNVDKLVEHAEFQPILNWLFENIHQKARLQTTPEVVRSVLGRPLSVRSFTSYLNDKFQFM